MDERRNGTRRLYRARPEGLAELKAFLEEFWDDRLEALKREAEREERRKHGTGRLRQTSRRARARDRGEPGDGLGVPRRPGEGRPLDGAGGVVRRAPRRRVPHRGDPGHIARAASSSSSTRRTGSSTRGAGSRASDGPNPVPPGSSTVEIELVPDGDGTLLRFTHRDLPSAEAAESHAHGWDHYLGRLAIAAAGRRPGRPIRG